MWEANKIKSQSVNNCIKVRFYERIKFPSNFKNEIKLSPPIHKLNGTIRWHFTTFKLVSIFFLQSTCTFIAFICSYKLYRSRFYPILPHIFCKTITSSFCGTVCSSYLRVIKEQTKWTRNTFRTITKALISIISREWLLKSTSTVWNILSGESSEYIFFRMVSTTSENYVKYFNLVQIGDYIFA